MWGKVGAHPPDPTHVTHLASILNSDEMSLESVCNKKCEKIEGILLKYFFFRKVKVQKTGL